MLHVSARYLTATTQDLVLAIRKEPSVPRVFAIYSDDGSGDQIPGPDDEEMGRIVDWGIAGADRP